MALSLLTSVVVVAAVTFLLLQVSRALSSPLRSIPGPFVARFTNLWYLRRLLLGNVELDQIALHRKYNSKVIRYGPNRYSISDPDALKKIYPHSNGPDKSAWYSAWSVPGQPGIFPQPSETIHRTWRRAYGDIYSMSSMVGYEGLADECIDLFCARIGEFAASGKAVDLAWWFQCYAADTVAMITYGKRFGYLDEGKDVGGILEKVHRNIDYAASMGVVPYLHPYVFAARALLQKLGIGQGNPRNELGKFNNDGVTERREMRKKTNGKPLDDGPTAVLDRFLDANDADPQAFPEDRIHDGLISNIVAGSDTTAMTLCAAIYHLLRNPTVLAKVQEEVDEAGRNGELSTPVTFKESNKLEYLQAVVQETLRIHPAVGLTLERIAPPAGLEIDGYSFPPGTVVGANAWVIHRDAGIFGRDPDEFRPERWLEVGKEQLSLMNRCLMAFGIGSRVCLGKNISMMEISKLIPELVRRFDMYFSHDALRTDGWKTRNSWFVFIEELPIKFKVR